MSTDTEHIDEDGFAKMESQKSWREHGGSHCPWCAATDVEGDSVEITEEGAEQIVNCLYCGGSWMEHHKRHAFEVLSEPTLSCGEVDELEERVMAEADRLDEVFGAIDLRGSWAEAQAEANLAWQ